MTRREQHRALVAWAFQHIAGEHAAPQLSPRAATLVDALGCRQVCSRHTRNLGDPQVCWTVRLRARRRCLVWICGPQRTFTDRATNLGFLEYEPSFDTLRDDALSLAALGSGEWTLSSTRGQLSQAEPGHHGRGPCEGAGGEHARALSAHAAHRSSRVGVPFYNAPRQQSAGLRGRTQASNRSEVGRRSSGSAPAAAVLREVSVADGRGRSEPRHRSRTHAWCAKTNGHGPAGSSKCLKTLELNLAPALL